LVHEEWPAGAVVTSAAWQFLQFVGRASGAWASPWQDAHFVCPERLLTAFAWTPWHDAQFGERNVATSRSCGAWQFTHASPPAWNAWSSFADAWHDEQGAANGSSRFPCGA
jgi:hypothetical protein